MFGSSEAVSKTGCFCITEWGGDSASHPLFQNDQKTAIPKEHEVISHFPHQGSEDEMTPLIMKDCWYHSGNKLLEMKPLIASESCISCKCILILSTVVGPAFIIFPCHDRRKWLCQLLILLLFYCQFCPMTKELVCLFQQ